MYRVSLPAFLIILALVSTPGGAESRIELVDGTEIIGDLLSVSDGRYLIRSEVLGQIEVPESSVLSIRPGDGSDSDADGGARADVQSMQQQIVSSPELMQMVMALQSDPQIQSAISDPEFLQSVMSGSLQTLQDDPRILQMLADPSIQAIIGRMLGP